MDEKLVENLVLLAMGEIVVNAQQLARDVENQRAAGSESPLFVLPDRYVESVLRLIDTLPRDHWLKTIDDFTDVYFEELNPVVKAAGGLAEKEFDTVLRAMIRRLMEPPHEYRFEVPVSCVTDVKIEGPIGGDGLRISAVHAKPEGQYRLMLGGSVSAVAPRSAIAEVNRIVATLLGLAATMNLTMLRTMMPPKVCEFEMTGGALTERYTLDPSLGAMALRTSWTPDPSRFSSFEKSKLDRGRLTDVAEARLRAVTGVLQATEAQSTPIRNAASLVCEALASDDYGRAVAFFLMSMEAVLLDDKPGDVLSRLAEAVTFRLGISQGSRQQLRKEIKTLYAVRSRWVHSGRASCDHGTMQAAARIAMTVLEKECWDFVDGSPNSPAG